MFTIFDLRLLFFLLNSILDLNIYTMALNFTADSLRKKADTQLVSGEVLEIYRAIKGRIREAHHAARAHVVFDLPDTFRIETMSKKDTQIVVYSELIRKLEEENFEVRIEILPHDARLYISWPSLLDDEDRKNRTNLINRHLLREKTKKKFPTEDD
jgi:hypothetical protein